MREPRDPLSDGGQLLLFAATGAHLVERLADYAQQPLVVERLFQEILGAGLHRLDGQGNVAVAGDHHHRNAVTASLQLTQQIQSAHFGHAHVGDDATFEAAPGEFKKDGP